MSNWIGDPNYKYDKAFRDSVYKGLVPEPSVDDIAYEYLRFINVDSYSVLHNEKGELMPVQQPKLGNQKHARKFFARTEPVIKAFNDFQFDRTASDLLDDAGNLKPVIEAFDNMAFDKALGRDIKADRVRLGYAFFITLTYDHKLLSPVQAYARVSKDINLFKAHLEKILGPYVCQTVKEASESGYPAPHLLFICQRPKPIFRHNGKWRLKDYRLYKQLHNLWYEISGSEVSDIEAVVDNAVSSYNPISGEKCTSSAIRYVFKYMTKSLEFKDMMDDSGNICIPEYNKTRVYTLAMMKFSGTRTILSRKFCSFLGVVPEPLDVRLVELCNELKRLKARKKYLERLESKYGNSFGWVLMPESKEMPSVLSKIDDIKARQRDVKETIRKEQGRETWIFEGVKRFGPGRQASLDAFMESIDRFNDVIRKKNDRAKAALHRIELQSYSKPNSIF